MTEFLAEFLVTPPSLLRFSRGTVQGGMNLIEFLLKLFDAKITFPEPGLGVLGVDLGAFQTLVRFNQFRLDALDSSQQIVTLPLKRRCLLGQRIDAGVFFIKFGRRLPQDDELILQCGYLAFTLGKR